MKDMFPLCCATHPQRKTGEYGSHVISNAKSTLYQGLRSGRRSSPGTAPMSCRRCSSASFGIRSGPGCEPFVPASRPPNSSWQTRYARHFPNFSWLPQKSDSLTKFIAERQDTENMRTFRLASRTKRRTLEISCPVSELTADTRRTCRYTRRMP